MPDKAPKVSVCTTTYNSGPFIEETILGVVNQKVSFDFEYVIFDDCSSDDTPSILRRYAEQYPEIIKLVLREENVGLNQNFMAAVRHCRGEYIALLDGDDYWTDENKLQLQHDFLEQNEHIALCATASLKRNEELGTYTRSHRYLEANTGEVKIFDTREMYKLAPFWLPTHSLLLRSRFVHFPDWFSDVIYVDRALRLIVSLKGDLAFINTITCVYRLHGSNTSADRLVSPEVCRGYLHTYWNFYRYSGNKFGKDAARAINHALCEERRRILEHDQGGGTLSKVGKNFVSALRYFQIRSTRDLAEFGYHFLFLKDIYSRLRSRSR